MKNLILFLVILLGLFGEAGCSEMELPVEVPTQDVRLSLTVNTQGKAVRALPLVTTEGENEQVIHRLDCFFYLSSATVQSPALLHLSRDYSGEQAETTVEHVLSTSQVEMLFPGGEELCKVYVLANLPTEVELPSALPSVEELKQLIIQQPLFDQNRAPADFVMDSSGEDAVTFHRSEQWLTAKVELKRAAAKISLSITNIKEVVEQDAEGNEVVWTAQPEEMRVWVNHGVWRGHVDTDRYPYSPREAADFYDTRHDQTVGYHEVATTLPDGSIGHLWEPERPFYSYAFDWDEEEINGMYLILVVPWHKSTEKESHFYNCYYQIAIHSEGKQLLRNHYYKINLAVSTLGSFVEEKPTVLTPGYVILDWNTNTIDATLEHYRYLMVAQENVVLNNQEKVVIPFFTSHTAKILQAQCTRPDLSENIVSQEQVSPSAYTLKLENQQIVFQHELNNEYEADDFDFTPYTLKFRIAHADQENYYQDVVITQYPAIYAEADMNSDYHHDYSSQNDNRHNGYAFVNGYYTDYYHYGLDKQDYFCSVPGYVNRKGSPNMYVFTITSVEGTDYIIGDPREKEISDIVDDPVRYNGSSSRSAWVSAPVLEDGEIKGKRRLKYYYATDGSEATRQMISPKFRIASAYSVMHTNEYPARMLDAMKKRCAAYQEDGYPAGRWRLPTQAEFQFIMSQVDKGKMPELYIRDKAYWCAHGLGKPKGNGRIEMEYVSSSYYGSSTRCVYDEWYWEDQLNQHQKKTFTWGDQKR